MQASGAASSRGCTSLPSYLRVLALLGGLVVLLLAFTGNPFENTPMASKVPMPGGQMDVTGSNDPDAEDVGQFVVSTIAKEQNAPDLKFVRVVSATKQVVAGLMWRLTVEANTPVGLAKYKATVYQAPGPDAPQTLEKYELVPQSSHDHAGVTESDFGARLGGASSEDAGLKTVDPEDPSVEDAAQFAIKQLQSRSNSLVKPEIKKVKEAKAQVGANTTFYLTLELQHGNRTETVPVVIERTKEGQFTLSHVGPPEEASH